MPVTSFIRGGRHALGAIAEAFLIAAIVMAILAALAPVHQPAQFLAGLDQAAAARGSKGGGKPSGGTLSPVVLDGPDAVANHGERLTFDVTTTATDRPFVGLKCWQEATGVYNSTIGVFESYLFDPWFTLDSQYWTAGVAATCTARLYHYDKRGNQKELATLALTVEP